MDELAASATDRPVLRRRYLVHDFQYRLLFVTFVYFLTAVVIFSVALFSPLIAELDDPALPPAERGELGALFLELHSRFWPAILVTFLLLGAHSVVTSNRIAGPLYRFRGAFQAIGEGDLSTSVTIRDSDYLHGDAEALNEMVGLLRGRISELRSCHDACRAHLSDLRRATSGGKAEAIEAALDGLRGQLEQVEERLRVFRTERD